MERRPRAEIRRALIEISRRGARAIKPKRDYEPYVSAAYSRGTYQALAELIRRHEDGSGVRRTFSLNASELSVFSQNGEDGVIDELLRRLGPGTNTFVEFGCGRGFQANCVFLADVVGWRGVFMEADPGDYAQLDRKYIGNTRVSTVCAEVTPANVEALIDEAGLPSELDVISIDVDGDDYWIWQALERYRPRIVVIEYNSALGIRDRLVQPPHLATTGYRPAADFGASIAALRQLGEQKGYRLAHTDLTGVNAFFVRGDLGIELPEDVVLHGPNFGFTGLGPAAPGPSASYVDPVSVSAESGALDSCPR